MGRVRFEWDEKKNKENEAKHGVMFSALGTGEEGGKSMRKEIKYTDEPLGDLRVIKDFLPSPEELAFKEENIKVTIALSKTSVDFFKKQAQKHHTQYQKMIRRLVDFYVTRQLGGKSGG